MGEGPFLLQDETKVSLKDQNEKVLQIKGDIHVIYWIVGDKVYLEVVVGLSLFCVSALSTYKMADIIVEMTKDRIDS